MPHSGIEGEESTGISWDVWAIILISVAVLSMGIVISVIFSPIFFPQPRVQIPSLDVSITNQSTLITILHQGGDSLQPGEFRLLVDDLDQTANFTNSGPWPWSAGEILSNNASTMPTHLVALYRVPGNGEIILFAPRPGDRWPSRPAS